jgi:hypothetical protein
VREGKNQGDHAPLDESRGNVRGAYLHRDTLPGRSEPDQSRFGVPAKGSLTGG